MFIREVRLLFSGTKSYHLLHQFNANETACKLQIFASRHTFHTYILGWAFIREGRLFFFNRLFGWASMREERLLDDGLLIGATR